MDGILVIDKPGGWTSHDVVAKVRRLTGIKRVGHTGTLDPLATGVLVVCLGQATRVVEYLAGHDKRYRATIRLGVETDTYDADGETVARRTVEADEAALRRALAAFVGDIQQVPPMYSALKRDGRKLVDLARRGVEVARAPRRVTIHSIDLLSYAPPDATIDVRCSGGTYIRALAHEVGRALGCGAHLAALTRTAAGDFRLDEAVSMDALAAAAERGAWTERLLPLDAALSDMSPVTLSAGDAARARHGAPIPSPGSTPAVDASLVRVYDPSGRIVGVMRIDAARGELRPEKIFTARPPDGAPDEN